MENKEIARLFDELARLMEYHGESPFKIRSYQQAYQLFRTADTPVISMDRAALLALSGVGEAIADKVLQVQQTGSFKTLNDFRSKTPHGVMELLEIKGLGPKKVKAIVDGLDVHSPVELLYACEENRLCGLHGFGAKSQETIAEKVSFYLQNKGSHLFAQVVDKANQLIHVLKAGYPSGRFELTGELRRKEDVIRQVDILTDVDEANFKVLIAQAAAETGIDLEGWHIQYHWASHDNWGTKLAITTAGVPDLLEGELPAFENEAELFRCKSLPFILPERRNPAFQYRWEEAATTPFLEAKDIRGILHAHSTWSDGAASIYDMAMYCQTQGFSYLGLTDHSRSAGYAGGLSIERLFQQMQEIDEVNSRLQHFTVFKGIESDILTNGSLDYPDDVLASLDFVIASVHSVLQMDEAKATSRLIQAIENPYTTILGHPSGRLLRARSGYPLDYPRILDAAAANGVAIEINANPNRLDLDYSWIPYAMEKGIFMCINPDAHHTRGIHDIQWGLVTANKGGLLKDFCLNCYSEADLRQYFVQKRGLTKR
jgi:DNA polymerase (family X)